MQLLLTTATGAESATAIEAQELGAAVNETGPGYAVCVVQHLIDACRITYQAQSITKAIALLGRGAISGDALETIRGIVNGTDVGLLRDKTFVVRCTSTDEQSSQEMCAETGGYILDRVAAKVDVKNPDVIIYVHTTGKSAFLGIDLAGIDLSKRSYRVFAGADNLKGTTAYAMLRLAGYSPGKGLVDPFCRSGSIPIEAALWSTRKSPHHYDKEKFAFRKLPQLKETDWDKTFREWDTREETKTDIIAMDANFKNVMAAKKNAKIAGVNKAIHFSRTDLTWLDAKFGKHAIDSIVSLPIQPTQRMDADEITPIYKEFFYQAEYVLKKDGTIALLMRNGIDILISQAKTYRFEIKETKPLWIGKEEWKLAILGRVST